MGGVTYLQSKLKGIIVGSCSIIVEVDTDAAAALPVTDVRMADSFKPTLIRAAKSALESVCSLMIAKPVIVGE